MLFTHSTENNNRAKAFWHKIIGSYTESDYTTEEKLIDGIHKLVFRFDK